MTGNFSEHIINEVTAIVFYEYIFVTISIVIFLIYLNSIKKNKLHMIEVNNYAD